MTHSHSGKTKSNRNRKQKQISLKKMTFKREQTKFLKRRWRRSRRGEGGGEEVRKEWEVGEEEVREEELSEENEFRREEEVGVEDVKEKEKRQQGRRNLLKCHKNKTRKKNG